MRQKLAPRPDSDRTDCLGPLDLKSEFIKHVFGVGLTAVKVTKKLSNSGLTQLMLIQL